MPDTHPRNRSRLFPIALALALAATSARAGDHPPTDNLPQADALWAKIAPFFSPPPEFAEDFGGLRSPLLFDDGSPVKTASDWPRRRQEILDYWTGMMGEWPALITKPDVKILESEHRDHFEQYKVRFDLAPGHPTDGYLLIPDGDAGPKGRPAVVVVFYEPETGIGIKGKHGGEFRDFALQLARRGYVTLSIGIEASLYYPNQAHAELQPLSANAYGAANAWYVLASRPEVDPERIGITGHSYGGKWAMFASCLFDKFACAAWSDPGVVFDEARPNVNYWEPWYIGYEAGKTRKRGLPTAKNPAFGPYVQIVKQGHDLHELHALMAPRPFLVSGGAEDRPARWKALNHAVAVNRLLGFENRVAMTNRELHSPNAESNEQLYTFFDYFLKHNGKP